MSMIEKLVALMGNEEYVAALPKAAPASQLFRLDCERFLPVIHERASNVVAGEDYHADILIVMTAEDAPVVLQEPPQPYLAQRILANYPLAILAVLIREATVTMKKANGPDEVSDCLVFSFMHGGEQLLTFAKIDEHRKLGEPVPLADPTRDLVAGLGIIPPDAVH